VVDPFIAVLASDRVQGNVSGSSVTPDYLRQVFAQYGSSLQNPNMAFNPAYLDRALDYLAQTDKQRSEGVLRSSFSVGA
jgi:DNA-binding MurR/RpiR family transcriptional regulator